MALAVDAVAHGNNGAGATTVSWSHTVGAGSNMLLVVGVDIRGNQTVSSVTYGASSLTKLTGAYHASGTVAAVDTWYLLAPTSGTATVTVTLSSSATAAGGSISFSGADQTTTFGTPAVTNANSSAPSVTVTSQTGAIVFSHWAQKTTSATNSDTPGGGVTDQYKELGVNSILNAVGGTASGAASVVTSWTSSISQVWTITGVSINAAAGGATKTISGSCAGVATVSSGIVRTRARTGSPAGIATVSGGIVRTRAISVAPAGVATVNGSLVRTRALSPISHGVATVNGTVKTAAIVGGISAGLASVSGGVVRIRALSPAPIGRASVSAQIVRTRALSGTSTGRATVTGAVNTGSQASPVDNEIRDAYIVYFYYG